MYQSLISDQHAGSGYGSVSPVVYQLNKVLGEVVICRPIAPFSADRHTNARRYTKKCIGLKEMLTVHFIFPCERGDSYVGPSIAKRVKADNKSPPSHVHASLFTAHILFYLPQADKTFGVMAYEQT